MGLAGAVVRAWSRGEKPGEPYQERSAHAPLGPCTPPARHRCRGCRLDGPVWCGLHPGLDRRPLAGARTRVDRWAMAPKGRLLRPVWEGSHSYSSRQLPGQFTLPLSRRYLAARCPAGICATGLHLVPAARGGQPPLWVAAMPGGGFPARSLAVCARGSVSYNGQVGRGGKASMARFRADDVAAPVGSLASRLPQGSPYA